MPTITETLRSRWKPEYATRITGGSHAFDTALSFIGAAATKRAELAKPGTLSAKGVEEGLRAFIDTGMGAELKKFRAQVDQQRADLAQRRAKLGTPKIDPADAAAAVLRSDYRAYLRGLSRGDLARVLLDGKDAAMLTAALEAPGLAGLDSELLSVVTQAHIERTAPDEVKAIAETEEALAMVDVAVRTAETDIASTLRDAGQRAAA